MTPTTFPRRAVLAGLGAFASTPLAAPAFATDTLPDRLRPGAYLGSGADGRKRIPVFEAWLGAPISGILDSLAYKNWIDLEHSKNWMVTSWTGFDRRLTLTVPMLTNDTAGMLQLGSDGKYDDSFKSIAKSLVLHKLNNTIIRIGHEFNGNWNPWGAKADPRLWVTYWRRIAKIFRETPGADFRLEWSPNLGVSVMDPALAWPGGDLVDIIGSSFYNDCVNSCSLSPSALWQHHLDMPVGLRWHSEFAAAKGKPVAYSEWGTGVRKNGQGGGDDPAFIHYFYDWLSQQNLHYHDYFDFDAPGDYIGRLSREAYPKSSAEFRLLFGHT